MLVLDDAHRITDRGSLDVLAAMLDHLPSGFRVAIAGRHDPGLPLARLRASRLLLEVGQDRLALDEHETAALAEGAGCTLSADEVRALASRTEGWPAGTYLAALAHGRSGESPGPIGEINGGDRFIAAYLGSEVEAGLDPDDLDLLARTAVLESVTPAAATALTGVDGVALRLRAVARRNLLVQEVGAAPVSFRYHNLLREYLLARAGAQGSGRHVGDARPRVRLVRGARHPGARGGARLREWRPGRRGATGHGRRPARDARRPGGHRGALARRVRHADLRGLRAARGHGGMGAPAPW